MTESAFEPRVTSLVRSFSLDLDGNNETLPVGQALNHVALEAIAHEKRTISEARSFEQWLKTKYPSDDGDTNYLKELCGKVAELWADSGHLFSGVARGDALPSVETLFQVVDAAASDFNQKRQGARGKFVDGFQSFVGTLNDHSYLFSIIPDDDKYLSLLTGVLTSIAKISVNRKTLAEAFASELSEIKEELIDVPKVCDVGNRAQMMPRVVKLYIRIFEFLYEAMCWYQSKSKRFKACLNGNYYARRFQPLTANIRKAIASIHHGAELITQQKVGYLVERLDRNQVLRIAADDLRHETPAAIEAKKQLLLENFMTIGKDSTQTLCAVGEQFFYDQEERMQIQATLSESGETKLEKEQGFEDDEDENKNECQISRSDLRRQADTLLATFTDDGRETLWNILRGNASPLIPEEVSIRIQSWIRNSGSQLLWIDGPVVMDSGSSLSLTALRIYELTMQAEIPCVSFFCKRKYGFMSPESTTSEATLMTLLYTVMDQLINLLPTTFESTSKITLETLDLSPSGGTKVATAALDVVEQLLSYAPPTVTFIIDGLELVSNTAEVPYLVKLIELLRTAGGGDKVLKVLLTTSGNSMALGKAMHWKERVDGSRFAQGRPGKLLRGATELSELR
ncbi:hypothetical protein PG990_010709 [Apiospora arundinis]